MKTIQISGGYSDDLTKYIDDFLVEQDQRAIDFWQDNLRKERIMLLRDKSNYKKRAFKKKLKVLDICLS